MKGYCLKNRSVRIGLLITAGLVVNLAGLFLFRQTGRDHALISAIEQQDTALAIRLLDEGADANAVNRGPVEHLVYTVSVVEHLRQSDNGQEPEPLPALGMLYIPDGRNRIPPENPALIEALLAHGARTAFMRTTILHLAAGASHVSAVRMLLDRGMDPNVRDAFGATPLTSASPDTALELINRGADLNATSQSGYTPLMDAANRNDLAKIKLLLKRGADINAVSGYGESALYYAVMHSIYSHPEPQTVRFLLDHGARVDLRAGNGKTAFEFAAGYKDSTFGSQRLLILRMLEDALWKERAAK